MFALEEKVVCKREKECESENAKKNSYIYYLLYEIIYDCENENKKINYKKKTQLKMYFL